MLTNLQIALSIALGISVLTKIIMGMKYRTLKDRRPQSIMENFGLYIGSIIGMWFPVKYDGKEEQIMRLKNKINIVTYVFYGLVVALAIVIYIQIERIKSSA